MAYDLQCCIGVVSHNLVSSGEKVNVESVHFRLCFPKPAFRGPHVSCMGVAETGGKALQQKWFLVPRRHFHLRWQLLGRVPLKLQKQVIFSAVLFVCKKVSSQLLWSPKHQVWKLCCGGHVILIPLDPGSGFFNTNSEVHDTLTPRLPFQGKKPQMDFLHTCGFSELFRKDVLPVFSKCLRSTCPWIPPDKAVWLLFLHPSLTITTMNTISSTYQTISQVHYTQFIWDAFQYRLNLLVLWDVDTSLRVHLFRWKVSLDAAI